MAITESIAGALARAGFAVKNNGTPLACFSKQMKACDMPYTNEHVVDGENVHESSVVIIEVRMDGRVSIAIPDFPAGDEGYEDVSTPEGLAIIRDAGVELSS